MTMHAEAIRRALTSDDRALVKRLIDGEVRRRHQDEAERTAKVKRSYFVAKAS